MSVTIVLLEGHYRAGALQKIKGIFVVLVHYTNHIKGIPNYRGVVRNLHYHIKVNSKQEAFELFVIDLREHY